MEYLDMKKSNSKKNNKTIKGHQRHSGILDNLKRGFVAESGRTILDTKRKGLSERFSSLGYIHNRTDVIQPKLICTYEKFAEIHNSVNVNESITHYVQYMLRPELPVLWAMIEECNNVLQDDDDNKHIDECRQIAYILSRIRDYFNEQNPQRLQEIRLKLNWLSNKIIECESWMERKNPEAYKNAESSYLYMGNEDVKDNMVKVRTREIFSRLPLDRQPTEEQLNGGNAYLQSIATLTFTEFRCIFNDLSGLLNIMNHIYESWKLGQVVDRRSEDKKRVRANTPDDAGGIRCIHTDTNPGNRIEGDISYRLSRNHSPDLPAGGPQAYHDHVINKAIYGADNSKKPSEIDTAVRTSGKFLVEYSGVPFGGERKPHNNKIVFNYLTGDIYVTFNHYRVMMKVDMAN